LDSAQLMARPRIVAPSAGPVIDATEPTRRGTR
jgi:hypothetical protein